jgi:dienelactone hydrolase
VVQLNSTRAAALAHIRQPLPPDALGARLRDLLGLPAQPALLNATTLGRHQQGSTLIEEVVFYSEPGIRVPGWLLKPATGSAPPVVLYLQDHGSAQIFGDDRVATERVRALISGGRAVFAVDLRGIGSTLPAFPASGPQFWRGTDFVDEGYAWSGLTFGKPVIGQRVWDALRALEYLRTRSDLDRSRISLVASHNAGITALFAAALDLQVTSVAVEHTLTDYRNLVEAEDYALPLPYFVYGLLRECDLPDVMAAIAPRPLALVNSAGPNGQQLADSAVRQRVGPALDAYARANAASALRIISAAAAPIDPLLANLA